VGEFRLQVGDVVDYGRPSQLTIMGFHKWDGFDAVSTDRQPMFINLLLKRKVIHRPTPNGMVQVWPEAGLGGT
jgi:hypothetical protein